MADSPSKKRKLGKPGGSRKGAGAPTNISKLTRGTKGSPAMQDAQSVVRIDTVFFNKSTHPPPPPPSSSSCAQSSAITTASCPSSAAAMSGVPGRTEGAVVNKPFSAELQLGLLQRQMADLRRDMGMKPAGSGGKAGAIETGGKAGAIETGAMGGLQAIFEQLTFATKQLEETLIKATRHATESIEATAQKAQLRTEKAMGKASAEAEAGVAKLMKLKQGSKQLAVLESEQTATLSSGKVICVTCTEHSAACVTHKTSLGSNFIATNGGVPANALLKQSWDLHQLSNVHKVCSAAATAKKEGGYATALQREEARRDAVLEVQFKAAAHMSKHKQSFAHYEHLMLLLKECGVDIGECNHGRQAGAAYAAVMAATGRDDLHRLLTCETAATGRLRHFGIAADKLTDLAGVQYQMVVLRFQYNGSPVTVFATNQPLNGDYDADHNASGMSCYNKIVNYIEETIGIKLFAGTGPESHEIHVEGHSIQWRTTTFDGEACYNGEGGFKSAKDHIMRDIGFNDKTHTVTHDYAHSYDLLVADMHKAFPYLDKVHALIKAIYSHFSQSPKKARQLQVLAEAWGAGQLVKKLHYLFNVRFVESEFIAVTAFLQDLPLIVAQLQDELDMLSTTDKMHTTITGWLRQLKQFKFVAHLVVLVDIHTVSKVFSKNAQSDELLIIDVPAFRSSCKSSLEKLRVSLGPEATKRLPDLTAGKLCMLGKGGTAGVLLTVEEVDTDAMDGSDEDAAPVTRTVQVGMLPLMQPGSQGKTAKERLLALQKSIVNKLLSGFETRIQNPKVAHLLSDIFDYRKMNFSKDQRLALLEHGDDSINEVCETYFPELDPFTFQSESMQVKQYVAENAGTFTHAVDEKDATKGVELRISGPGSVMEALFTQPGISGGLPITNYLHVADYMISFCWQSCCGERVGSHINVVKTKGRSTLGDVNFDNAVFNTFNMPPLHHIDYAAFVRAWKKQGKQRMATLRKVSSETGDGGVNRSEVIRRHLSAGAGTPLYT